MRPALLLAFLPALTASAKEDPYVEGEVLITFRQDVPAATAKTAMSRHTLNLDQHFDQLAGHQRKLLGMARDHSRTTAALIADLKNDPDVETAEPNYIRRASFITPNDPYFTRLWGLQNTGQTVNGGASTSGADVRFMQAWNLSRASSTIPVVAVIDSGVDITHPDLTDNIWTNPGEIAGNSKDDDGDGYVDDIHGYDFASAKAAITDSGLHGTHVSGIIAAAGKNNLGVIGLQFHAKVIPMKVSTDGENFSTSAILSACNYTVKLKQKGINIVAVNASYGGGSFSTSEQNAIIALRDAGIVFCAAAGNETANNDSVASYPANYNVSNIISVAALTQTNDLASFSNYGATTVDLAAPGANIYSTVPVSYGRSTSLTANGVSYDCLEVEYSGTTVAAGLTKPIYNCGFGTAASNFPSAVSGNIALIQRGTNNFSEKVTRAKTAGAVGVIIYDNTTDPLSAGGWTLGVAGSWLPTVQVTQATGTAIIASSLPKTGTLINAVNAATAYAYLDGTSMATPQVTAAVAFAAWNFPSESMAERISRILNHTTAVPALAGKTVTGGRLDLLKMIDTDGDGLPDWWEMENFGSLDYTASDDPDGDGFSNLAEFLAGTSPLSADSHLTFASYQQITDLHGKNFVLTFPTVAERSYHVEWSEDLQLWTQLWTQLGSTVIGTGSSVQITDTNVVSTAPKRFYRLVLEQ